MEDVVISLLAPVPPPRRKARWVEEQVDRLRAQARSLGVQLGRLTPSRPSQGGDWIIKVERDHRDKPLEQDITLALILTDLARLGLRPCLFVITRERGTRRSRDAHRSRTDASRRQPVRHTRPTCRSSRSG